MYKNLYKRASQAADDIINGTYQRRSGAPSRALIERPSLESAAPKKSSSSGYASSYSGMDTEDDPMMEYMVAVRKQNAELAAALAESYSGSSPTASYDGNWTPKVDGEVGEALKALGQVESRGNYKAIGPTVKKGMYKGQNAIGKYQVMEGNIPSWTKAALGKSLSKEEFLNDKGAQDAVAAHRMQMSKDKYGSWDDAASVWFSGRPLKGNTSDDGYNTVPEYVSKFRKAWG